MQTAFKPGLKSVTAAVLVAAAAYLPFTAHAGLFDDDEARKAILDIRSKIEALQRDVGGKADKNSALTLSDRNENLQSQIAALRGQIEALTNEVSTAQQRQKDFYTDLDARLRKLEPQQVNVDGQSVAVGASEQQAYDAALAQFKGGDYKGAANAFADFLKRYPQSGYAASAQYWQGNALYLQRDFKGAIAVQQNVVKNYPENPKVPDALLNIAGAQTELKDKAGARKTLESLISKFPNSAAAQTGKERLPGLK